MQKLEVQLAYQDKPSYIRAIENADFFVTNDIRLARLFCAALFYCSNQAKQPKKHKVFAVYAGTEPALFLKENNGN